MSEDRKPRRYACENKQLNPSLQKASALLSGKTREEKPRYTGHPERHSLTSFGRGNAPYAFGFPGADDNTLERLLEIRHWNFVGREIRLLVSPSMPTWLIILLSNDFGFDKLEERLYNVESMRPR